MGKQFDHDIWTLKKLAEGRDYSLYIAFWPQEDEKVLVKHVNPSLNENERQKVEERLLKEAATLEEFWSAHFPKIYDIRRKGPDDQLYIISEYFPGTTLKDFLESSPKEITSQFYLYLKEELLFALSYLHKRKKIIHLDLSPDNIIIDLDKKVHLIDFENSKLKGETWNPSEFRGKPGYLAPELKKNEPLTINEGLDYFALGKLLEEIFNKLSFTDKLKLWGEQAFLKKLTNQNPHKRSLIEVNHSRPKKLRPILLFLTLCLSLGLLLTGRGTQVETPQKTLIKRVPSRAPALPQVDRVKLKQAAPKKKKVKPNLIKPLSFREQFNQTISQKDHELKQCLKLFHTNIPSLIRLRYHFTKPPTRLHRLEFITPENFSSDAQICIRSVFKDPRIQYPAHESGKSFELTQSIKF